VSLVEWEVLIRAVRVVVGSALSIVAFALLTETTLLMVALLSCRLRMLECRKFESVDCHKVKVTFKFRQTCRLLTVDIVVTEHNFDS